MLVGQSVGRRRQGSVPFEYPHAIIHKRTHARTVSAMPRTSGPCACCTPGGSGMACTEKLDEGKLLTTARPSESTVIGLILFV